MLISGILSIVQVLFLPGFLLLFFLNMHKGILRCILLSCVLSLIINFFIVYLLTLLHLYTPFLVYCIVALELSVLVLFRNLHQQKYECFPSAEYALPKLSVIELLKKITVIHVMIFALVVLAIVFYFSLFYYNASSSFIFRDAVISFNRWAINWYHGILPTQTWDYPQLLSANWSLTYQFLLTDVVQLFANAVTGLFPLLVLFVLLDLGFRKKQLAYFIAIVFTAYLFRLSNQTLQDANYVVAFFTLMSFYLLILAKDQINLEEAKKLIYLGAFTAAGAALSKQSGIFIAILYPLFVYLIILKDKKIFRKPLRAIFACYLVILLLLLPWYAYKYMQIMLGKEHFAYSSLMVHVLYHSYLQRVMFAFHYLINPLYGRVFGWILIPLFVVFGVFANKIFRQVFFLFVFPYFLIWLFCFSYDPRNLDTIFPILAIVMGYGAALLIHLLGKHLSHRLKVGKFAADVLIVAFCLVLVVVYYNQKYNSIYLIQQQTRQQMRLGMRDLNASLYQYFAKTNYEGKILTNLLYAKSLPVLRGQFVFNKLTSMNLYYKSLKEMKPQYLVVDKVYLAQSLAVKKGQNQVLINRASSIKNRNINQYIKTKLLSPFSGRYKIIINKPKYMFVKITDSS